MPLFDLEYEELVSYRPEMKEPEDFDRFWADTLAEAVRFPLNARFDKADYLLEGFETYDVTFSGYGGGRGFPTQYLVYAGAGYAHFLMDTRGQGSSWQNGDTPDFEPEGGNPQYPGLRVQQP